AAATPAAAAAHSPRRSRSASAPTAPMASQPMACSPNSDIAWAVLTTGGLASAPCTLRSATVSGVTAGCSCSDRAATGSGAVAVFSSSATSSPGGIRGSLLVEDLLPGLRAGQLGQCGTVRRPHPAPLLPQLFVRGQRPQPEPAEFLRVAAPERHTAAVGVGHGRAVQVAQQE